MFHVEQEWYRASPQQVTGGWLEIVQNQPVLKRHNGGWGYGVARTRRLSNRFSNGMTRP